MMTRYVALLRGINVGGKNKVAMQPLAALFAAAGCRDVTTYIQSGNVVFTADHDLAPTLPQRIAELILVELGVKAPITLRSVDELTKVVAGNPLLAAGLPAETLHVLFLADQPDPARVATLDPERSRPDRFLVAGREVYLHLPSGVAGSKLTVGYFDSRLATIATGRNWRTVVKLLDRLHG